ncbi:MAG: tyrosine-type recombinase/integrase [Myxococcota bacterium]
MWRSPPDPETGSRTARYGATKREAVEAGKKYLAQPSVRSKPVTTSKTLDEGAGTFLVAAEGRLRPATISQYRTMLKAHILPRRGQLPVHRLTRDHVESLYQELRAEGVSTRTLQAVHIALRQVVKHAIDQGWVDEARDPMAKVKRPGGSRQARVKDTTVPHWTTDELKALLVKSREVLPARHALLVETLAGTGVRIAEALGLKFRDHNARTKALRVERTWTKDREVAPVKSDASRRTIALTPELSEAIAAEKKSRKAKPDDFIFASEGESGLPLDQNHVRNRVLRKVIEAAQVPHHGAHAFRHTHATLLIERGTSPKVVQLRLGHVDVATTLSTYGHATSAMQDAAVIAYSDLLM